MTHIIHSQWYWHLDKAWLVNPKSSGLRTDILRTLIDQLSTMIFYHNKVFIYRFDLRIPCLTETNELITNFNRRLFKRIRRYYKITRIGFCWAREKEKSKQQHYHYVLMLDGSKVQSPKRLQHWIRHICEFTDSSPHWAGFHNISRNDEAGIQRAFHHISYLAKPRGKGKKYRPKQTKDYSSSRLK